MNAPYQPEYRESYDALRSIGIRNLKSYPPCEVRWLWYPYIPRGKLTILQGDPSGGKTTLMLSFIAALSRGLELCDPAKHHIPSTCLYQTAEDGLSDTVVPRLLAANADLTNIITIDDRENPLTMEDMRLASVFAHVQPDLIVLDPLQAFLGDGVDMHRANEVRPRLAHLAELADRFRTAVVLIGHLNKRAGDEAMYRGLGSIDIPAAARSVLLMEKSKTDPRIRTLRHVKSSLAPEGKPLDFLMGKGTLTYMGVHEEHSDAPEGMLSRARLLSYAIRVLLGNACMPTQEVQDRLRESHGTFSRQTWTEAKRLAGAETFRRDRVWMMRIAPNGEPSVTGETPPDPSDPAESVSMKELPNL